MKKKLESELVSIAHRILKLKGREDVDRMHKEVSKLYEKLTVLKFAQENFEDDMPTIGNDSSFFDMLDTAFNNKIVISQINTTNTLDEAQKLITEMVKPDYNNWEGKDEYEDRFIEIIEGKFN